MKSLAPLPSALLTVVFPASRSASYPAALGVADCAERRLDATHMGTSVHLAEFGRSPGQANFAVALLAYLAEWRGVQVFVGGRAVGRAWGSLGNVERVLRCYTEAGACPDPRAHCRSVESGLFEDGARHDPVIFPCRHILRVFPRPLSQHHPASDQAQVFARAVAAGCDFCPLFDATALSGASETRTTSGTQNILPGN